MSFQFPAIVALIIIVSISYEQTIHAYPGGGSAYIVARDNLGTACPNCWSCLADRLYTHGCSVHLFGIAQIASAFPGLYPYRVEIAVGMVFLVMLINLRGVKESGITFAIPTYFFLVSMLLPLAGVSSLHHWEFGYSHQSPGRNFSSHDRSDNPISSTPCLFLRNLCNDRH